MFDKNFVWGCASSAVQIEGAWNEDGKGESIWDRFCHEGRSMNGATADVACDFYHRYKEDIAIMKQMGVQAYRFALSWTRIIPQGTGKVNQKGIDFYRAVIDELLANGIEPYLTLYHWDLPQALQDKGGWLNEDCVKWFADYAAVCAEAFSDKVTKFITLNEPQCFTGLAFINCEHAPAFRMSHKAMFQLVHNALKAHGAAVIALREHAKQPIEVGYAPTCSMVYPTVETPENMEACRKFLFRCNDVGGNWAWCVSWFSDPVFLGKYPEEGLKKYAEYLPEITDEDMALISQPLDFMGENIYNGDMVESDGKGGYVVIPREPGAPVTGCGWPVTPECLHYGLRLLYERYHLPIYLTENGCCCKDVLSADGKVHDPQRIDFLNNYILAMKKAIDAGVDVRGYFQWTLTDTFEWNFGYRDRFGLVYVDFATLRRYRKDSSFWYEEVIRTNGASLMPARAVEFVDESCPNGETITVTEPVKLRIVDETKIYITEGYGNIHGASVRPGDCVRLCAGFGEVTVIGDMKILIHQ